MKNLTIFRVGGRADLSSASIEQAIAAQVFVPCTPGQIRSVGWVPPRGEDHGALAEASGSHTLLRLRTQSKILPSAVIQKRVDELVGKIEKEQGRKPGKRERREIKAQAIVDLLPQAFAREADTEVWVAQEIGLLCIGTSSAKVADEVASLLARAIDGLSILPILTRKSPSQLMADWLLSGDPPASFTVDRECELKSVDEMKSVVRYGRHPLDIEEVREHIAQGKRPTRLATTWAGRVSFVLTDGGQLKKIDFLDGVFEGHDNDGADEFDASAAILTGELERMLPDLIEALGGEMQEGGAQ